MILHIFKAIVPIDVSPFPPSVITSGWVERLSEGANSNGAFGQVINTETQSETTTLLIWNSEEELTNYVNTYRLTDAALISDLDTWKATHGISFITEYYTVSGDITVPGVV